MISSSDVIKSVRDVLIAESGASWNTAVDGDSNRVYPAGVELSKKKRPFVVVGVENSEHDKVQIPDDRRMETFQTFITCIADDSSAYAKGTLAGAVRDSLTAAKIPVYNHVPDTPVLIDSRDLMDIEIDDLIMQDAADLYSKYGKEITGYLSVYQDKT